MRLQTQALGDGRIQATVTAGAGALTLIRFGPMQNARIEVPGSSQTYGSNSELKPPAGSTTITFVLVGDPAAQAGQAPPSTTIPLTIYDGCGSDQPWSTFFGGGPGALQSTASVADTQVSEGNGGNTVVTFTITLSVPSSRPVTVSYRTSDGTARAGQDYVAADGTVTFNPGETSKTVTVQVRGNFTREPDKTFTITLSDPVNASIGRAQATARIVDDDSLPISGDDAYTAAAGQTLNVGAGSGPPPGLLANDQAASQDARIVSFGGLSAGGDVTSNPAGSTANLGNGGSLSVNADGSFAFTSPSTFTGAFSFRYRATSAAGTAEATVIIDVRSSPNAVDDPSYSVSGPAALQIGASGGLLANDGRGTPPGSIVSFGGGSSGGSVASTPAGQSRELGNGGTLTVNADGSFNFTAPSNAVGPFTFQYRLQNAAGADDATATIQVLRGATVTTTSGSTAFLEGGSPTAVDGGATVTTPGNANLTRLTATIGGLTDAGQETLSATTAGTSIVASYVAPTLTLSGDDTVAHYQQVLRTITYQNTAPSPTAGGRTIQFQATSGGQAGNTATKTVTVGGLNDAPVGTSGAVTTNEDTPYTFQASDFGFTDPNDTPPNGFKAVKITTRPAAGTLLLGKTPVADGQFVSVPEITSGPLLFVPASDANSVSYATFTFQVQDDGGTSGGGVDLDPVARTMAVNVTPVNDAPKFVIAENPPSSTENAGPQSVNAFAGSIEDGDPELSQTLTFNLTQTASNGSLTFSVGPSIDPSSGALTYTATAGTHGTATFSVTLSDDGSNVAPNVNISGVQTFTITVTEVNDAPVALNDAYSTGEDTPLSMSAPGVLGNDSDPDGAPLTAALVNNPAHGSVTLHPDGSFLYTPNANYHGPDSFTYKANDGTADSNVATVTITVNPVNDPPQANALSDLAAQASIPISFPAGTLGGTDSDTGAVTVDETPKNVTNGTVSLASDGSFTFTPLPNAAGGTASFQYRVTDGAANSEYATVSFNVAGPALYFVKATAVGLGDCTLGNECTLSTASNPGHAGGLSNARIFIGDANSHPSSVSLTDSSWLIGQGVSGTSFDTVFGITPPTGPGAGTLATRPAIGTSAPTVTSVVNMGEGSNVRGLQISVTGNATGLRANGRSGLVVSDVPLIQSVNGPAVSMNDSSGSFAFTDVSATGSGVAFVFNNTTSTSTVTVNDVTSSSSSAVRIQSPGATNFTFRDVAAETGTGLVVSGGTGTLSFRSVSSGAGENQGMNVSGKTGGSVAVTGDGSTAGSGGTITGKTGTNGQAVALASLSATDVSLSYMMISNTAGNAIRMQNSSGTLTLDHVSVTGAGTRSLSAGNYTGAVTVKNSTLSNSRSGEIQFTSDLSGTSTVTVSKSSLTNDASLGGGQNLLDITGQGAADVTVHVTESTITGNQSGASPTGDGIFVRTLGGTLRVEVDHSSLSNHRGAISAEIQNGTVTAATLKANIHDNKTIVGSATAPILVFNAGRIAETAVHARIVNNTIGTSGVTSSGSVSNQGILLTSVSPGSLTGLIQGNTIYEVERNGIHVGTSGTVAPTGTTDMTIKDNVVDQVRLSGQKGIVNTITLGTNAGCADISGNKLTNIPASTKIEVSTNGTSTYNVVQARPTGDPNPAELDDANNLGPSDVFATPTTVLFDQPTCAQPSIP